MINFSDIHSDVIQNENLLCNQFSFLYYYYDIKYFLRLITFFKYMYFFPHKGLMFCWIDAL